MRLRCATAGVVGLGLWILAAVAAAIGQALASSANQDSARPWLVSAAVLGLPAIKLLEARSSVGVTCSSGPGRLWPYPPSARRAGLCLVALGALASIGATVVVVLKASDVAATLMWIDGLLAALVGTLLLAPSRPRLSWHFDRHRGIELGLLVGVLVAAFALRWYGLASIPPDVHGDEAAVGLEARRMIAGTLPFAFGFGWSDLPALSFLSRAATLLAFGNNLNGLRVASVIEGVASVAVLFLLARRLWGSRVAVLAAGFLAVAAWHIHFSRTGLQNIQATLFTLLAFYFLIRALQDRQLVDWLVAGFALGLTLETYFGARIAPVVAAIYLAYRAASERNFLRSHARGMAMMVVGATLFLAPFGAVLARNPDLFGEHSTGVMVTSGSNLQHELDGYHVNSLAEVLAIQTQRTLEAFNLRGETSLQYGHPAPLFDPWTGGLLAVGALGILLPFGGHQRVLLALWVWMSLLIGSILTIDALFSPREVVVIPALVLVSALTLEYAWRGMSNVFGRAGTWAFTLPAVALIGLACQANVHDYFDIQIVQRVPAGRFTLLSRYVQATNDRYQAYIIGRADYTFAYDTPRFLVPGADVVNVRDQPLALPLEPIPPDKGVAFFVESSDDNGQRLIGIRSTYPHGREETIFERPGHPAFISYLVENSDLIAASPATAHD